MTGCPCGCLTRLPWFDDPDCVRHTPFRVPTEWDAILRDLMASLP